MLQGTCSNAGKSMLTAGLCRAFTRRGLQVRPFKPQNMSNNAAVTIENGEIGRAQALQARACGVAPSVHMNPVLLKPQAESGAQLIVQGQVWGHSSARDYYRMKPELLPHVVDSFRALQAEADLVLVEGAGSPAEINLRAGDIANMGFARAVDLPVVLVGDIERGGVIASLVGTHRVLNAEERLPLAGYIVNKFRGDSSLFDNAHPILHSMTGLENFGVVPWFKDAHRLPEEDSLTIKTRVDTAAAIRIGVLRTPRISNFDDLDPLLAEPDVALSVIQPGEALPGDLDLVILAGSKATISDLAALRAEGWQVDLAAHRRRGGYILGLCGGYQMLGTTLADPEGIEGQPGAVEGLGLLDVTTTLAPGKILREVRGSARPFSVSIRGYEMHLGVTSGPDRARPLLDLAGHPDGAMSADRRVIGTYVHGLFADDGFRSAFLNYVKTRGASGLAYDHQVETTLDRLAEHLEQHVKVEALLALARHRQLA